MRRYIGIGIESSFGSGALPKYYSDVRAANLETPSQRYMIFNGVGRSPTMAALAPFIPSGSIELPAELSKAGPLFRILAGDYGSFGTDLEDEVSTTLSSASSASTKELVVASGSNFSKGDIVQLGADFADAELHKVNAVISKKITLDEGLLKDHVNSSKVKEVKAPYTHFFRASQDRNLTSAQVDVVKDFNAQSFKGSVANGMEARLAREFLDLSFDLLAKSDTQQTPVDLVSNNYLTMNAYNFADVSSLKYDPEGDAVALDLKANVQDITFSIANDINADDGIRFGSISPQEFVLGSIEATMNLTLAFNKRSDLEALLLAGQPGKVNLILARGSEYSLELQLPRVYMTSIQTPLTDGAGPESASPGLEAKANSASGGCEAG